MPFLFLGALARFDMVPAPEMLAWTASDAGILLLLVATLLEVLGDKIPVVDHALDLVATFAKPVAGLILPVALLQDFSPMAAWVLGIAAGGPLALGVHSTKAGTRALSSATTVGTANPLLSFAEDLLAGAILLLTVLAPVLAGLLAVALALAAFAAWRRMRRRGRARAPATPGAA